MKYAYLLKKSIIHNIIAFNENNDLYPIECSYENPPVYKELVDIKYSYYSLHYVVSGKGKYIINGKEYPLSAGDIFFIFPNTVTSYVSDESEPWTYCWINFEGLKAKELLKRALISKDNPIVHGAPKDLLAEILCILHACEKKNTAMDIIAQGRLYIMLSMLIALNKEDYHRRENKSESQILKAVQYINENYADSNLSVTEVARHAGFHPGYFSRLFKSVMGTPFSQYLIAARIQKACSLIQMGEKHIKEIAYACGYSDALYFSKQFRKIQNCTPTEYIEIVKSKSAQKLPVSDKAGLKN